MLAKRIIPCLDVKDGRVVKGVNFVNLRDAGDPVEIAAAYEKEGADELTFLDITASHEKRDIILDVVAHTAEKVFMPLTVGGGFAPWRTFATFSTQALIKLLSTPRQCMIQNLSVLQPGASEASASSSLSTPNGWLSKQKRLTPNYLGATSTLIYS